MVAANGTRKARRHGNDAELGVKPDSRRNDRNKNAERTPRRTCRERKTERDKEDYRGQERHESRCVFEQSRDEVFRTEKPRYIFERRCERQNDDSGNHRHKSFRNGFHRVRETYEPSCEQVNDDHDERDTRAYRKSDGRVCISERAGQIMIIIAAVFKESAVMYKRENARQNEHDYRNDKVEHLAA